MLRGAPRGSESLWEREALANSSSVSVKLGARNTVSGNQKLFYEPGPPQLFTLRLF